MIKYKPSLGDAFPEHPLTRNVVECSRRERKRNALDCKPSFKWTLSKLHVQYYFAIADAVPEGVR